jgi:hypothetical protein
MNSRLEDAEVRARIHDAQAAIAGAPPELRIVTLDEFVAVDEPGARAVVGDDDAPLIAEGGDAMGYGDGGVGKTTLFVDLGFHLAAGDDWLGISIPRARAVLFLENEGPRSLFRKKLKRKWTAWNGSSIGDRVNVYEDPWGRFSFADDECCRRLADEIREREIDVLIVGPVTSVGMEVGGTAPEVRAFLQRVGLVRALSSRPIAVLLVHHENKGGRVSGAWEGVGDTLLHVQQQGRGHVRLYVQKARWSSAMHATTMQLVWAAGDSFERVEAEDGSRPERTWNDIETFVLEHGGTAWGPVRAAIRVQADYLARRRNAMLEEGILINTGKGQKFELWHRDDPARPALDLTDSEGGTGRESGSSATGDEGETGTDSPIPPVKGESGRESVGSWSPADDETGSNPFLIEGTK